MKKFYLASLLMILSSLFYQSAFATHAAGGELIYELIPGTTNTYKFTFKFYRDCGDASQFTSTEPASFSLCYTSPCTGTIQTLTMPKIVGNIATIPAVPNGSPLDNGCNSITTCDDINSTVHGYRQWWYSANVTLPVTCNAWKFWTTLCCRNDITQNITTPPGSQYLYVEANFDNTVTQANSSPYFVNSNSISSLPVPYVCINLPYNHTGGAVDPDGDSLVFETIEPRHKTGCNANAPVDLLLPAFNILNTSGDPLPTNNSYNLNTTNGHFGFTPSALGYYALCIKVSEYRNGVLIGSVMRDMQVVVDVCTPLPVSSQLDSLTIVGGNLQQDTIQSCPGSNLSFCFDIIDAVNPTAHVYHLADNHSTVLPGSTVVMTNPSSNILRVCVNWTSTLNDTNINKLLTVIVQDSMNCVMTPGSASVPIHLKGLLFSGGDTTICPKDTVSIWAKGNSTVTWQALPGGSGNSSMSCTQCNSPIVWPDKTTSYEVTDDECGFKDTVTITMLTLPDPVASFTLSPNYTTMADPTFTLTNTSMNALTNTWYDEKRNFLSSSIDYSHVGNIPGLYCFTLEVNNFCGVVKSSTKCATILEDGSLAFPNAFTPNGDNLNETFKPVIIGEMSINNYSMSVYDRWGKELFKAKNLADGWNGRYKGKDCSADTYFFYAETYNSMNKKMVFKGDLLLIR